MLAPIYTCPVCGDVWRVQTIAEPMIFPPYVNLEEILEKIPHLTICKNCGQTVKKKLNENGSQWYHHLTEEEKRDELFVFTGRNGDLLRKD